MSMSIEHWRANRLNSRAAVNAALIIVLALVPGLCGAHRRSIRHDIVHARSSSWRLAALSLNLIMGFGGMVSFGHAAYLGIGGYAVGILAKEGVGSGFVQWPVAIAASALYALVVGALSLRTRGVYFIMITLAFAQMVYYVVSGLDRYGGDDGLTIYQRSRFGSLVDLNNNDAVLLPVLGLLLASIYLVWRIVNSRFGLVIRARARTNCACAPSAFRRSATSLSVS